MGEPLVDLGSALNDSLQSFLAADASSRWAALGRLEAFRARWHLALERQRDLDPTLRAELVRFGLLDEGVAIQGVLSQEGWDFRASVEALLPALSPQGQDRLLAEGRGESWPLETVVTALANRGLDQECLKWLTGEMDAALSFSLVEKTLKTLSPDVREAVLDVVEARPPGGRPEDHSWELQESEWIEAVVAHASALAAGGRTKTALVLMENADERLEKLDRGQLYADPHYGDEDTRLVVADGWIALKRENRALRWLDDVAADPSPWSGEAQAPRLPKDTWALRMARVAALSPEELPANVVTVLQRWSAVTPSEDWQVVTLGLLIPVYSSDLLHSLDPSHSVEQHKVIIESFFESPEDKSSSWWSNVASVPGLSLEKRTSAAQRWADRVLEVAAANPHQRDDYGGWYELSQHAIRDAARMGPLLDEDKGAAVLGALESWAREHIDRSVNQKGALGGWVLQSLLELVRSDEEQDKRAATVIRRWAEESELPVWQLSNWADLPGEETARATLTQTLDSRPAIAAPKVWLDRLTKLAERCPDPALTDSIVELAAPLARRLPPEDFVAVCRVPSSLQASLVEELLQTLDEKVEGFRPRDDGWNDEDWDDEDWDDEDWDDDGWDDEEFPEDEEFPGENTSGERRTIHNFELDNRNHVLRELLPELESTLARRVALAMCEVPEGQQLGSSPWWTEVVAEVLPESEWEGILRELIERDAIQSGALSRPALPPVLRAEQREQERPSMKNLQQYGYWLGWHGKDLDSETLHQEVSAFLPLVEAALEDEEQNGAAWTALGALVRESLPFTEAIRLARREDATPDYLGWLVFRLTEAGQLEMAESLLSEKVQALTHLRVALMKEPSEEDLLVLMEAHGTTAMAYPWVVELVAAAKKTDTLMRVVLDQCSVEDVLSIARAHSEHLGEDVVEAVLERVMPSMTSIAGHAWLLPHLDNEAVLRLWSHDGTADGMAPFAWAYLEHWGEEAIKEVARTLVQAMSSD